MKKEKKDYKISFTETQVAGGTKLQRIILISKNNREYFSFVSLNGNFHLGNPEIIKKQFRKIDGINSMDSFTNKEKGTIEKLLFEEKTGRKLNRLAKQMWVILKNKI